jgi:hypothetical protein
MIHSSKPVCDLNEFSPKFHQGGSLSGITAVFDILKANIKPRANHDWAE